MKNNTYFQLSLKIVDYKKDMPIQSMYPLSTHDTFIAAKEIQIDFDFVVEELKSIFKKYKDGINNDFSTINDFTEMYFPMAKEALYPLLEWHTKDTEYEISYDISEINSLDMINFKL